MLGTSTHATFSDTHMVMTDTLFSRIIDGSIPCHKVYEDPYVLAFLDINPLSIGHTLLIPKEAKATMGELSDESAAALGRVLPRICRAICEETDCQDYNILQNNGRAAHQAVFHVHFHIIPKPSSQEGLGVRWPTKDMDHQEGAAMALRLKNRIL